MGLIMHVHNCFLLSFFYSLYIRIRMFSQKMDEVYLTIMHKVKDQMVATRCH